MMRNSLSLVFMGSLLLARGMLVKNWGLDILSKRLSWSTKLLIEDSEAFLSLGLPDRMVLTSGFTEDFVVNDWTDTEIDLINEKKSRIEASFKTYNSWFEDFFVNHTMLQEPHGKLRRFILNRAERLVHEKEPDKEKHVKRYNAKRQHEMIICDECIALEASRYVYGFETNVQNPKKQSWGVAEFSGPIRYLLSFQINLVVSKNDTNRGECLSTLDEFKFEFEDTPIQLDAFQGDPYFNFLADHIHDWTRKHLNSTVESALGEAMKAGIEVTMSQREMCKDFLTTGIFTDA